jgi:predicted glycoside hydrolase/deacetylase ChbG (UPF0249 family)
MRLPVGYSGYKMADGKRYLIVAADDYGIGPATSQGILDLAVLRRISATVLLVNSPYARTAVEAWREAGRPVELGWHPCLTLDQPVLPARRVPSLVNQDGRFWPLGSFMGRLFCGRIRGAEIDAELRAQYERFHDLVGCRPTIINSHHHVQVLPVVGAILCGLLPRRQPLPYVRRVREPWGLLSRIPGARVKRSFLTLLGRRNAALQQRQGIPGNDWLAGITDPPYVADPDFFSRWLGRIPGRVVELTCHPGHLDPTLIGRDCTAGDGQIQRRVGEWHLLRQPAFVEAYRRAGFELVSPSELLRLERAESAFAA